jgi:hypothetical protein
MHCICPSNLVTAQLEIQRKLSLQMECVFDVFIPMKPGPHAQVTVLSAKILQRIFRHVVLQQRLWQARLPRGTLGAGTNLNVASNLIPQT